MQVQFIGANDEQVRNFPGDDPRIWLTEGAFYVVNSIDERPHCKFYVLEGYRTRRFLVDCFLSDTFP